MRPHTAALALALAASSSFLPAAPAAAQDAVAPVASTGQAAAPAPSRWFPASGADLAALLDGCESDACMSYVAGALAGLSTRAALMGGPNPFCPTGDTIETAAMRDAILATVAGDPALQTGPAPMAIVATFASVWPCPDEAALASGDATTPESEGPAMVGAIPLDALVALAPGTTQTLVDDTPSALILGEPGMDLARTLVVFHDANCIHCAAFKTDTDALAAQGWRVVVVPVGMTGPDAHGYAALMVAFASTRPDAVEALYRGATVGEATVAKGLAILETQGITAPDALSAVSTSNAYDTVTRANDTLLRLGGKGTPTWILSDMLATGGASAEDIAALSQALAAADAAAAQAPAPLVLDPAPSDDAATGDGKNTATEAP